MKVSIITINYNNADGLLKTIQSVFSQTCRDFEYIIVDGASTDNSVSILKDEASKFASPTGGSCTTSAQQDSEAISPTGDDLGYKPTLSEKPYLAGTPQIGECRVGNVSVRWVSEEDKGIYNAMNKGIQMATGEYCIFMNSGDYFAHNSILQDVMKHGLNADIVCGHSEGTEENGQQRLIKAPDSFGLRHVRNGVPHQAEFIKTSWLRQYGGYDESFRILADLDFNLWACLQNATYQRLDMLVSIVDLTGISCDNANYEAMKQEGERIQQKHLPKRVWEDYDYFTNKKKLGNPAINWLINNPWLFKIIKGVYYKLVRK